jgi:hypothetical protein
MRVLNDDSTHVLTSAHDDEVVVDHVGAGIAQRCRFDHDPT